MLDRFLEYLKKLFSSRLVPIVGIYIILFFVLIIRMFMLQIVDSDTYVDKAEQTEVKEQEIQSAEEKYMTETEIFLLPMNCHMRLL